MKRSFWSVPAVFALSAMLGLTGCDGGGVEPGMGDGNQPPAISPEDMSKMANMMKDSPPSTVKKIGKDAPAEKGGKDAAPKN